MILSSSTSWIEDRNIYVRSLNRPTINASAQRIMEKQLAQILIMPMKNCLKVICFAGICILVQSSAKNNR